METLERIRRACIKMQQVGNLDHLIPEICLVPVVFTIIKFIKKYSLWKKKRHIHCELALGKVYVNCWDIEK